jgi:uncharacterized membrane protein YbhN (UPF0104 family)
VDTFIRAVEAFLDYVASIGWAWLGAAVACHLAKAGCRSRAWRTIVAAAYPEASVRWRDVYGAYVAGVGVNALLPARGGDLVRLSIARHRVEGSTYPTLASTFLVETLFDLAVSLALFVWAVRLGVLPGLDVLPNLPAFDLSWVIHHPYATAAIVGSLLALLAVAGWRASRHVIAFRERVAQGFAVLGDWKLYLRGVVAWQAADWILRIAGLVFFMRAFGLGAGLHEALLVQVTQSVSTLVPLTPAGIGTQQALVVYVLRGEFSAAALLSFSVGMKLVVIGVNLVVGFAAIGLMLRTFRWRRHLGRAGELAP